jgi:hypothetical protein
MIGSNRKYVLDAWWAVTFPGCAIFATALAVSLVGDGLNDAQEVARGADPLDVDSDNDGLLDNADVLAGGDPLLVDTDNDGLDDLRETQLGTDLARSDTDGDSLTDFAEVNPPAGTIQTNPRAAIAMASDANKTLTQAEARADILDITSVGLTATRNIVLPLAAKQWIVANLTTGGQALQFIGATGTGVTVANAKRAIIYSDGTNIVRAGADV